jgi:4-hydroxy-tetrahydrodipicolinate synthase
MPQRLEGVYSVLPTPFRAGGEVDHASLTRVIDLAIAAGVDGVTALGVTGEASRLSDRERTAVVETAVRHVNGRCRVVVGTSADGLRLCADRSREAKALGGSAVMISPPRAMTLNTESVVNHYRTVAEAVDLPIVIQDCPPLSGFAMEAGLLARIAREVPAARTIKLEDPPTPFKTSRIIKAAGETRVAVLGGLGGVFLIEELMAGAAGVMTGFGFPEVLVRVVSLFKRGRRTRRPTCSSRSCRSCASSTRSTSGWPCGRKSSAGAARSPTRPRGLQVPCSTKAPGARWITCSRGRRSRRERRGSRADRQSGDGGRRQPRPGLRRGARARRRRRSRVDRLARRDGRRGGRTAHRP